jgi:flagellar L-ring protein precursor FlgH
MNRLAICLALALLAGVPGLGQAQPVSLFSDPKAANIGDVLTVIIAESASATNQTATSTDKSNQAQVSSTVPGGGNLLSFIPLHSLQSNASNQYQGRASTSRSAQLTARITVTVVGKKPNGDLIIEGSRNLKINGETEAIYLSGTVNPAAVGADNTILSSSVGELQLEYTGKGTLTQGSRPGIFVRLLNWIF